MALFGNNICHLICKYRANLPCHLYQRSPYKRGQLPMLNREQNFLGKLSITSGTKTNLPIPSESKRNKPQAISKNIVGFPPYDQVNTYVLCGRYLFMKYHFHHSVNSTTPCYWSGNLCVRQEPNGNVGSCSVDTSSCEQSCKFACVFTTPLVMEPCYNTSQLYIKTLLFDSSFPANQEIQAMWSDTGFLS